MTPIAALSEDDVGVKYITAALHRAGWDKDTQIWRQVSFTRGRIVVRGKLVARGRSKHLDLVLYHQHIALGLIEASRMNVGVGHGMQQALDYATTLDVLFVFSSNGTGPSFTTAPAGRSGGNPARSNSGRATSGRA